MAIELYQDGYFTAEDVHSLEPFLFIGLPAVAVVRLALRSLGKEGLDFEELTMTQQTRPHNAFADSIWHSAMRAKSAAAQAGAISDQEAKYLTVMALQRPEAVEIDLDESRKQQLCSIVAAAVDLSITASRSRNFKHSIQKVIEGILQ